MKRQQRPRGATTTAAIVAAALELIDHAGVEALTIRALAKSVGVPPMSLYTHFKNKAELLDLAYAEVARRLYAVIGHDTWQAELSALCFQIRERLLKHPRWAPLLARPVSTALPIRERLLGLMIDDGMAPDKALQALSATPLTAIGLTLLELTFREPDGTSTFTKRFERLRADPGRGGPAASAAFSKLRSFDMSQNFAFTVSRLVRGLEAG